MNNSEFEKFENSKENLKLDKTFENFKIMVENRLLDCNDCFNDLLQTETFNQKVKNDLIKFDYILNFYLIRVEREFYKTIDDLKKLKTD